MQVAREKRVEQMNVPVDRFIRQYSCSSSTMIERTAQGLLVTKAVEILGGICQTVALTSEFSTASSIARSNKKRTAHLVLVERIRLGADSLETPLYLEVNATDSDGCHCAPRRRSVHTGAVRHGFEISPSCQQLRW
jgi:hypothetical protein